MPPAKLYEQCGGDANWKGPTSCQQGMACHWLDAYYAQCRRLPGYQPLNNSLKLNSSAPLLTFYMYRVMNDQNYPPENQNMANLAGALWYLHNEIVWHIPRRFGKTRIQRFKVQTRAPQPLYDRGMNFGVRVAFDRGQCTGPFNCTEDWEHYGFNVGCNNVGSFPTAQWADQVHYKGAVWYSLPGECPDNRYNNMNAECMERAPGGACPPGVTPTGQGNCTYSYEEAGEISIDELEGISNYWPFIHRGGREYIQERDMGWMNTFWNWKSQDYFCQQRVQKASDLFAKKYPDSKQDWEMPTPKCDFNYWTFYGQGGVSDDPFVDYTATSGYKV